MSHFLLALFPPFAVAMLNVPARNQLSGERATPPFVI
jgi:hypothetical protein